MTASTAKLALNDAAWTQLTTDETNVAVQLAERGGVLVYVGVTEPDDNSYGVLIGNSAETPRDFAASGLPDGASVWAKAQDGEVAVVVMKY